MLGLWTKLRLAVELRLAAAKRNAEQERLLRRYGCACKCACGQFLNDQVPDVVEYGVYRYVCVCGMASTFDYRAPVPLLVKFERVSSDVLGLGV